MELARHCELCDHQKVNLKDGTICELTGKKPIFNKTCAKIKLGEKFENKLKAVNIEFEEVRKTKAITYVYFIVFLAIGLTVIIGAYLLGKYALGVGVISTVPLIIMGVGLAPLGMAFGALNKYRRDLDSAKGKKTRVDKVLGLYRIEYQIDITFGRKYHGNQEIQTNLNIKGIR